MKFSPVPWFAVVPDMARLCRWPLRTAMAWLLVLILSALAVREFEPARWRAMAMAQWLAPLRAAQIRLGEEYAWRGLPPVDSPLRVFTMPVAVNNGPNGSVAWFLGSPSDSPVARWVCGREVGQATAWVPHDTPLPPLLLPPNCRRLP